MQNGVSIDSVLAVKSRNLIRVFSDASDWGIGAWMKKSWWFSLYEDCPSLFRPIGAMHIGVREIFAVAVEVATWKHFWKGRQIEIWCDNKEVVFALQKKTTTDAALMPFVRYICMMAVRYQFRFYAEWISTSSNHLADDLSRNRVNSFLQKMSSAKVRRGGTLPVFDEFYEFE